jgi:hypothetical protein
MLAAIHRRNSSFGEPWRSALGMGSIACCSMLQGLSASTWTSSAMTGSAISHLLKLMSVRAVPQGFALKLTDRLNVCQSS